MQYLTLADTYRNNAERHYQRGKNWLALGKIDYATNSFRKAKNNLKRSIKLDSYLKVDVLSEMYSDALEEVLINDLNI